MSSRHRSFFLADPIEKAGVDEAFFAFRSELWWYLWLMKTWRLPALHTKLTWLMSPLTGTDTENEPVCGFCGFSSSTCCLMNHTVTLRTSLDHQMLCTHTGYTLSLLCSMCQSDNTHYEPEAKEHWLVIFSLFLFTPVLSRSPSIGREDRQTGRRQHVDEWCSLAASSSSCWQSILFIFFHHLLCLYSKVK